MLRRACRRPQYRRPGRNRAGAAGAGEETRSTATSATAPTVRASPASTSCEMRSCRLNRRRNREFCLIEEALDDGHRHGNPTKDPEIVFEVCEDEYSTVAIRHSAIGFGIFTEGDTVEGTARRTVMEAIDCHFDEIDGRLPRSTVRLPLSCGMKWSRCEAPPWRYHGSTVCPCPADAIWTTM